MYAGRDGFACDGPGLISAIALLRLDFPCITCTPLAVAPPALALGDAAIRGLPRLDSLLLLLLAVLSLRNDRADRVCCSWSDLRILFDLFDSSSIPDGDIPSYRIINHFIETFTSARAREPKQTLIGRSETLF